MTERIRGTLSICAVGLLFVVPTVLSILPFAVMVLTSLTQRTVFNLAFTPGDFSLVNYAAIFRNFNFLRYFLNSLIVVTCACVLNNFIASMAGYSFAKKHFPFRDQLFWVYMLTIMIPGQAITVPLYIIMTKLGLLNTYVVLFLPIINAFGVFLTKQFIKTVPDDLLEAARIDGCGELPIYFRIVVPLIKPVLVSLTIFTFITSWNDFIWPLITTNESAMYTLTLGLSLLQGNYTTNYGLIMAGATLTFLPPFFVYLVLQRQFVEGIVLSGIKG